MREVLTPALVARLAVAAGRTRTLYLDQHRDAPAGFGLRVTAAGERSYYLVKRALGRKVWVRLGDAATLTLDKAREAARAKAGDLARDIDPTAANRAMREKAAQDRAAAAREAGAPTIAELVRRYIETRRLAPNTAREYRRTLAKDIEPSALGRMKAKDAVQADVRLFVKRLAARGKHQADRAFQLIRFAHRWGAGEEVAPRVMLVDRDPTAGVDRPTVKGERERRRSLINVRATTDTEAFAEVKKFWLGTETMKAVPRAYVRLLLLLGLRRTEASLASWDDIRLGGDAPVWHIAAEHRKVRVTRRDPERDSLDVPLPPLAVRILGELHELAAHAPRVFPHLHHQAVTESMRAHTGIGDIALHDLRRTCASGILRLGGPPHILTDVLGHRQRGLADSDAVYLQGRRTEEYREWLRRWAERVEGLAGGAARVPLVRSKRRRG